MTPVPQYRAPHRGVYKVTSHLNMEAMAATLSKVLHTSEESETLVRMLIDVHSVHVLATEDALGYLV